MSRSPGREPRWSERALAQAVQFEYEDSPIVREIRLTRAEARAGDPVRVRVGGVEIEARIVDVDGSVLHVRVGRKLF